VTLGGPGAAISEQVGDPVATLGGAVVSAPRVALQAQIQLATLAGASTTLAQAQALRRRMRSMLGNTPLKLGAFLYVVYSDDLEMDGWYVPDQTSLASYDTASWLAVGLWVTQASTWYAAGHRRTHREGRQIWLKDLATGLYARDALGWILSTDFSALPQLPLNVLANGATSIQDTVTANVVSGAPLPSGRDGGQCQVVEGLTDLTVLSYERAESALNLSDVIVYDRRGAGDDPTTGPGSTWEEVYGPDYPWNWQTSGQPADSPVLDNGLVRVRYDGATGKPGFRVDVWNGSAYVEQGKMTVERVGDSTGFDNTFVSASLVEWTPERAVMQVILANSADAYSRERIFVTMQRGEVGVAFECYPAPKAAGTIADAYLVWTPDGPDSNDSLVFEPSVSQPPAIHTDSIWSTASSTWTSASGTFSGTTANFLSILRCIGGASTVGPYQTNLVVVQQSVQFTGVNDSNAYGGTAQPAVYLKGTGGMGYLQAQVSFTATQSDQVKGSGSFTSTQASQYRVFGLVTTTWTDYGEYTGTSVSTGSSTRVEAHLTQDRTRNGAIYSGCRDAGQCALYDSRQLGCLVTR
jgi:hypothetical protein